jgi:hypothetical protein
VLGQSKCGWQARNRRRDTKRNTLKGTFWTSWKTLKEALDPKLEKAQGKFGQIFDKISKRLVRAK